MKNISNDLEYPEILVHVDNLDIKLLCAESVHSFLKSEPDYEKWIKLRIHEWGFTENEDYYIFDDAYLFTLRAAYKLTDDSDEKWRIRKELLGRYLVSIMFAKSNKTETPDENEKCETESTDSEKMAELVVEAVIEMADTKTSNELIPIIEHDGKSAVNARDLHVFLEVGRDFTNWIKNRIKEYDFIENKDYALIKYDYKGNLLNNSVAKFGEPEYQHVAKTEYAITLDMAKELSMVEGNEKGKIARRYFIERDNKLRKIENNASNFQIPQSYGEALILAGNLQIQSEEQQKQIDVQTKQIAEMQPKVEFHDRVTQREETFSMGTVAKILGFKNIGRNRLFEILREEGVLMSGNEPYQKYINSGYFKLVETEYERNGEMTLGSKVVVFQKGVDFILKLLKEEKYV